MGRGGVLGLLQPGRSVQGTPHKWPDEKEPTLQSPGGRKSVQADDSKCEVPRQDPAGQDTDGSSLFEPSFLSGT